MKLKVNRGVTLIEVLTTITISGILFAIIGTIIGTFNTSYERSKAIRESDAEIQYIENAISVCVEYANTNGYKLSIKDNESENTIGLYSKIDNEETRQFEYNNQTNDLFFSFSNTSRELKYIKSIDIEVKKSIDVNKKVGIILKVITIENVEKQSYFNVINLI